MSEVRKCWVCRKWNVSFDGGKSSLSCPMPEQAYHSREYGFVNEKCPAWEPDKKLEGKVDFTGVVQ